jgi:predicted nucleic acid-binding protein
LIIADTSAWIEFLRRTGHPVGVRLRELIVQRAELGVTEVIVMELLAGARRGNLARDLRSRLLTYPVMPLARLADFEEAAAIYRMCRDAGHSIRTISDCLIAVPVLREGASLLHNDKDFDVIARLTGMKIAPTA